MRSITKQRLQGRVTLIVVIVFGLSWSNATGQVSTRLDSVVGKIDSLRIPDVWGHVKLTDSIGHVITKFNSSTQAYNKKIDSLQSLKLPTEKYKQRVDSIRASLLARLDSTGVDTLRQNLEKKIAQLNSVQDSLTARIEKVRADLQSQVDKRTAFLDSMKIDDSLFGIGQVVKDPTTGLNTTIPGGNLSVPGMKLGTEAIPSGLPGTTPSVKMPAIDNPLDGLNTKVNELQAAPAKLLNESDIGKQFSDVKGQMQKVTDATGKAEEYLEEVKTIKDEGLAKSKMIPEELEKQATKQAMKLDEVKELQKQDQQVKMAKNMIEEYKEMALAMQDKDKAKDLAKSMAKELPDPFLNQEEKLKAGVAQLDKLKKKYGTIPDSRYLPKRVPNPMKEKSFRERIVPGVSLQFHKTGNVALDLAPYVSYKLTKRFRPGVGFDYRVMFDKEKPFVHSDEVYGYRAFNDFKLYGNFYLHTEGEWLHYSDSASVKYSFPGDDYPPWRFRLNIGLFRTYKISKHLDGQVQLLYNVMDMKFFPTAKNASLRFGVEYKFKARKKKE